MFKKILIILLLAVVGLVAYASTKPDDFKYTRTATINAPAVKIFPHVNNLHKWEAWSPWVKIDPNAKTTFEGPEEGNGAVMRWAGNMEVGEGSMTITESIPNEIIKFDLNFLKPIPGNHKAEFLFKEESGHTIVSWTMSGKNNLLGKIMSVVFDCEKMVSEQFDKGLSSLKTVSEAQ